MRKLLFIASAALAAAACSSSGSPHPHPAAGSSAPRVSAAAACRDFTAWWSGTGTGRHPGTNAPVLRRAVAEAPSGTLYQDMSAVQTEVKDAAAGIGGNPILAVAAQVRGDCAAVNPSS
ncbi:MAG TPA: hypothetical protein VGH57_03840 [Amycolatopsis sp.]